LPASFARHAEKFNRQLHPLGKNSQHERLQTPGHQAGPPVKEARIHWFSVPGATAVHAAFLGGRSMTGGRAGLARAIRAVASHL
jgi:hypothetical protein